MIKSATVNLSLDTSIGDHYSSASQRARVLTERWVAAQVYCPECGRMQLGQYPNNSPVADFYCPSCGHDFELKSTRHLTGKVVDGAYGTMMKRLRDVRNPSLFILRYSPDALVVEDLLVVPRHFFVPALIERRPPLSASAHRARWVGCNILLDDIPDSGRIFLVRRRAVQPRERVLEQWKRTMFLREETDFGARRWLLDIMKCIEALDHDEFSLKEMYQFENALREKHPANKHIRDKIRQQLQILRDRGYLSFLGHGRYSLGRSPSRSGA